MKKFVSLVLVCALLFSCGVSVSATEVDYTSMSDRALSQLTGISEAELAEARGWYGSDFSEAIAEYISCMVPCDENKGMHM